MILIWKFNRCRLVGILTYRLPDELEPLLNWFEDNNYVGRINRNGRGRRLLLSFIST